MITGIFVLLIILLSAIFVIASQYLINNIYLTISFSLSLLSLALIYVSVMRSKHNKTMEKLFHIVDAQNLTQDFSDNSLSALEYKLYTLVKSHKSISDRIIKEKERINGLISDLAHQIKTPLSNIIVYTDLLKESNHTSYPNVEQIREQAEKLQFLFDAMIKMSRCESGLITGNLHPRNHNIKELLAKAVSNVYAFAEEHNITISTNCDPSLSACFDMKWTVEAIFNVLENAVKYSPMYSKIEINVKKHEMFVQIDISDQGPGISEQEQLNIWKRFYRGSNAYEESGVGIGLYLTKQILLSQHGYVRVKSDVGQGSTFSLFLPIGIINK